MGEPGGARRYRCLFTPRTGRRGPLAEFARTDSSTEIELRALPLRQVYPRWPLSRVWRRGSCGPGLALVLFVYLHRSTRMGTPAKTEHLERPLPCDSAASPPPLPADPDEEERAFVREMMKESRRTTRREIERLFGPIEFSE